MHLTKNDIPIKIDVPGAVARQQPDFGSASGALGAEYFTLAPVRTSRRYWRASMATCATPLTGGTSSSARSW